MAFVNGARLAENILLGRRHKSRLSIDGSAKALVASFHRGASENKMPDVDLVNRHPALQSMCSKD
jgi:hypothetical protein